MSPRLFALAALLLAVIASAIAVVYARHSHRQALVTGPDGQPIPMMYFWLRATHSSVRDAPWSSFENTPAVVESFSSIWMVLRA